MSEITTKQLFDILKSTKKYFNDNFIYEYNDQSITYLIDDKEYKIYCYLFSDKNNFRYSNYKSNINTVIVTFKNESQILSNFGKIVKYINKLHGIITYKESIKNKLKGALIKYVKGEYNFELDFQKNVTRYDVRFSSYYVRYKKRYKTIAFDVKKHDINSIKYDIFLTFNNENCTTRLVLQYSIFDNNLIITRKDITYSKCDITSIIRSEKLKKLKFLSDV